MCDTENGRLEFKRKFILQNIADVKREWYRHDDFKEKLRFWFLTVWFGTLAILLKEKDTEFNLYGLLLIETVTFYGLEVFYHRLSSIRISRISVMEHWIMRATDEEILALDGPLAKIASWDSSNYNLGAIPLAVLNPGVSLLYWIFLGMSIVIEPLLKML